MAHNGGRSQVNFNYLQGGGDYPFLNHLKTAQVWTLGDNSNVPAPNTLDANGYPTSISNGGVYTQFFIPTQANRPGNWVVRWIGDGTITLSPTSYSLVSGSLSGVNGRAIITPTGTTNTFGSLNLFLGISAINVGNPITKLQFVHVDDEYRLDLPTPEVFGVRFKQKLAEGNFGVLRFLNWQGANTSNISAWAHRKPINYVFYDGDEMRSSLWGGTTTNSGNDYSLAFAGFTLVDKAVVSCRFNADATGTGCTFNVAGTGAKPMKEYGGATLDVTQQPKNGFNATLIYDADLGAWLKRGGDAGVPHAFLGYGAPIELMVQLANEMNAHPWFHLPAYSLDPKTDFATQLATYCKATLNSGLIPRFECVNEVWNTAAGFIGARYGANKANAHWGTTNDWHNWYGKVVSTMGQDVSAVYSADRSRYQIICGVQTATGGSASASNDRLNSTKYVTVDGGSAAKNWATHVACSNYWNPYSYGTAAEQTHATNYANAVGAAAKLAIATTYATEKQDLTDGSFTLARTKPFFQQWATWGSGLGVNGLAAYEGGFSPDYTSVSDLDTLRSAAKAVAGLSTLTTQNYNNFIGVTGATATFPSCFQLAGANNAWSVFDPDIYATPSPQWDAIVAFNAVSPGLQGKGGPAYWPLSRVWDEEDLEEDYMPEKSVTNYKPRTDLPKLSDTARAIVEEIAHELVPRLVERRIATIKDELFAELLRRIRRRELEDGIAEPQKYR